MLTAHFKNYFSKGLLCFYGLSRQRLYLGHISLISANISTLTQWLQLNVGLHQNFSNQSAWQSSVQPVKCRGCLEGVCAHRKKQEGPAQGLSLFGHLTFTWVTCLQQRSRLSFIRGPNYTGKRNRLEEISVPQVSTLALQKFPETSKVPKTLYIHSPLHFIQVAALPFTSHICLFLQVKKNM